MPENKTQSNAQIATHNLILENRSALTATGVSAIISYDAQDVVLETGSGILNVGGSNMHVSELSVQKGEVQITGDIEFLQYSKPKQEKGNFFQRLVR